MRKRTRIQVEFPILPFHFSGLPLIASLEILFLIILYYHGYFGKIQMTVMYSTVIFLSPLDQQLTNRIAGRLN